MALESNRPNGVSVQKSTMKHPIPIEYDKYYHIYNRGINGETLFREKMNYEHFIGLFEDYIPPVADIFAWGLLKNHFHFLVRIRSEEEIGFIEPKRPGIIYPEKRKHNPSGRLPGVQRLPPLVVTPALLN